MYCLCHHLLEPLLQCVVQCTHVLKLTKRKHSDLFTVSAIIWKQLWDWSCTSISEVAGTIQNSYLIDITQMLGFDTRFQSLRCLGSGWGGILKPGFNIIYKTEIDISRRSSVRLSAPSRRFWCIYCRRSIEWR